MNMAKVNQAGELICAQCQEEIVIPRDAEVDAGFSQCPNCKAEMYLSWAVAAKANHLSAEFYLQRAV